MGEIIAAILGAFLLGEVLSSAVSSATGIGSVLSQGREAQRRSNEMRAEAKRRAQIARGLYGSSEG